MTEVNLQIMESKCQFADLGNHRAIAAVKVTITFDFP